MNQRHTRRDTSAPGPHEPHCEWVDAHIEAYIDGDLDSAPAARLAAHLERCPRCAAAARLARDIAGELRAFPELDCPPALEQRLRGATAAPTKWPRWPQWQWAAAAALVLATGLGAMLWIDDRSQLTADQQAVARARAEMTVAMSYLRRASTRTSRDVGAYIVDVGLSRPVRAGLAVEVPYPGGLLPDHAEEDSS